MLLKKKNAQGPGETGRNCKTQFNTCVPTKRKKSSRGVRARRTAGKKNICKKGVFFVLTLIHSSTTKHQRKGKRERGRIRRKEN